MKVTTKHFNDDVDLTPHCNPDSFNVLVEFQAGRYLHLVVYKNGEINLVGKSGKAGMKGDMKEVVLNVKIPE